MTKRVSVCILIIFPCDIRAYNINARTHLFVSILLNSIALRLAIYYIGRINA